MSTRAAGLDLRIRQGRPRLIVAVLCLLLVTAVRSATGQLLGNEFQANTYTTGDQWRPALAADSSGNFVMVWGGPGDGLLRGVHGQRLAALVFADGLAGGAVCGWSASQGRGDACPP